MNYKVVQLVLVCSVVICNCVSTIVRDGNYLKNNSVKDTDNPVSDFLVNVHHGHRPRTVLATPGYKNTGKLPLDRKGIVHDSYVDSAKKWLYSSRSYGSDWKVLPRIPKTGPADESRWNSRDSKRRKVYKGNDLAPPALSLVNREYTSFHVKEYPVFDHKSKAGHDFYQKKGVHEIIARPREKDDLPRSISRNSFNVFFLQKESIDGKGNGLSDSYNLVGKHSRVRRDTPSANHTNQNSWPDQSSHTEMKLMSPFPPKIKASISPTTATFPKPTTNTFINSKSKASPVPMRETSPVPTTETSPVPTTETYPEQTTETFPKPQIEASSEPKAFNFKSTLPVSIKDMADALLPDYITNIIDQNTTQTAISSSSSSSTMKSSMTVPGRASTDTVLPEISTSTSESISSSEPTTEANKPYPERNPGDEPEREDSTPSSIAEPGPDWQDAKKKWSIAWEIHLYMLGGVFAIIAGYTVLSIIKLYQINRLLSKKYFVTLNLLIFLLCCLRAVFLLVDGYNANGTFPPVANYLIYSTAFPCLTSAFSILLYALLQATQMKLVPRHVQKIPMLVTVIFLHFALQITTDILVGTYAGVNIMMFVCQLVFIAWGLFLFCGYAYIFRQLYTSAVKRQKNYQYMLSAKTYSNNTEAYKQKFTLSLAVKVTFLAAIFGLVTIALEIYSIFGVYGVFQDKKPDPWPWWMYHTAMRLVECLMCIIMAYVASQPFRCRNMKTCSFICAPCIEMFKCALKEDASDRLGWSKYDQLYLTSNKRTNGNTNAKMKTYLNDGTDIAPIVMQSSTTIEDGYVQFQAEANINNLVDNYARAQGATEMATFKKDVDGIVNGDYIRSTEDTVRFQDEPASSEG